MKKRYHKLSDYDEQRIYDDNDVFILDDRPFKFDIKTGRIIRPCDPLYDALPMIDRTKCCQKQDKPTVDCK